MPLRWEELDTKNDLRTTRFGLPEIRDTLLASREAWKGFARARRALTADRLGAVDVVA